MMNYNIHLLPKFSVTHPDTSTCMHSHQGTKYQDGSGTVSISCHLNTVRYLARFIITVTKGLTRKSANLEARKDLTPSCHNIMYPVQIVHTGGHTLDICIIPRTAKFWNFGRSDSTCSRND